MGPTCLLQLLPRLPELPQARADAAHLAAVLRAPRQAQGHATPTGWRAHRLSPSRPDRRSPGLPVCRAGRPLGHPSHSPRFSSLRNHTGHKGCIDCPAPPAGFSTARFLHPPGPPHPRKPAVLSAYLGARLPASPVSRRWVLPVAGRRSEPSWSSFLSSWPPQPRPSGRSWQGPPLPTYEPLFLDKHSSVSAAISPAFLTPSSSQVSSHKPALSPGPFCWVWAALELGRAVAKREAAISGQWPWPSVLLWPHPALLGEAHSHGHRNHVSAKPSLLGFALPPTVVFWSYPNSSWTE